MLSLHDSYNIFISSRSSKTSPPNLSQFIENVNKKFGVCFEDHVHKSKFHQLQRLYTQMRNITPAKRKSFEPEGWNESFYSSDLPSTGPYVEDSGDEDEELTEKESGPAPKKFRKHILKLSKSQQHRRLDPQYSAVQSVADAEDITVIQLLGMLLYRASYSKNKEIADFAD